MKIGTSQLVITITLFCLSLVPKAQSVSPPPDGGYPGGNTAEGYLSLGSLTTGFYNTGVGIYSLLSITDGNFCTSVGAGALFSNTAGENTATGAGTLFSNSTGTQNTANGTFALFSNTTGTQNTAIGFEALFNNTTIGGNTGAFNTAVGDQALFSNTIGLFNIAIGGAALFSNDAGSSNTAIGGGALNDNTAGNNNTALGFQAGLFSDTGNNNVYIGAGMNGVAGETNACYIASIFGQTIDPATATIVGIDANNKLGTISSSKRFKKDIKPMDKASEALLALKPVTFHYKSDSKATPQFGLIAEEVAEVNPNLVVRDKNGEILTVHYDQVNAMLLNEFLKEHKALLEEQSKVQKLETALDAVNARLKEQEAKIEKVSSQVETSNPGPALAENP
jgi:hypothetical protein